MESIGSIYTQCRPCTFFLPIYRFIGIIEINQHENTHSIHGWFGFSVNHLIHFHRSLFVDPMDSHDNGGGSFWCPWNPGTMQFSAIHQVLSVNTRENQQLYWYHGEKKSDPQVDVVVTYLVHQPFSSKSGAVGIAWDSMFEHQTLTQKMVRGWSHKLCLLDKWTIRHSPQVNNKEQRMATC